jgi:hypothetical protein
MDDYYLFLNYTPMHLLETMYREASIADNYYLSPVNVLRCDASTYLRGELSKIINAPFTCCGFLKTNPLQTYPIHVDKFRIAAINMPLFEDTPGFKSFTLRLDEKKLEPINYRLNYFTMLNVTKPHGVINENTERERIMLSIGFKNNSYDSLLKMHNKQELINVAL